MRHVLTTQGLADNVIREILSEARAIVPTLGHRHDRTVALHGRNIALAFFEPSTRTRLSFETAAHRLGAAAVVFQTPGSSVEKGESLHETIATIQAMRFDAIIVRHGVDGVMQELSDSSPIPIVNAGEGTLSHPSQALLDASTLNERCGSVKGLRIAIVGDVRHSRVARSQVHLLQRLGAEFAICAPKEFMPSAEDASLGSLPIMENIDDAMEWCNVLSLLRIQRERMDTVELPSVEAYRTRYAYTMERARRYAEMPVIHPGPVNPGVEIDEEALHLPQVLIHRQVTHGVAVRMAMLRWVLSHK